MSGSCAGIINAKIVQEIDFLKHLRESLKVGDSLHPFGNQISNGGFSESLVTRIRTSWVKFRTSTLIGNKRFSLLLQSFGPTYLLHSPSPFPALFHYNPPSIASSSPSLSLSLHLI